MNEPDIVGGDTPDPSKDDSIPIDPRTVARVARLLRWYPSDWRARYGNEFEAMLYSSFNAGEGGARLSLDVVKEGLIARVVGSGVVGTVAPPLKRARASVAEIFVGIVGFLVAATVLSHYVERWRAFPTSTALERAQRSIGPVLRSAQDAIRSPSVSPAQRYAAEKPYFLEAQRLWNHAYLHQASGAPVAFDQIMHISLDAAAACLGIILVVGLIAGVTTLTRRRRTRLLVPGILLAAAGGVLVLREIAFRSSRFPYSFSLEIRAVLRGSPWAWPSVAYSLFPLLAVVLIALGGAILLSRAELGVHACKWMGRLAVGTGALLVVALVCTLGWALTLSSQAPGYLFWSHQGVFGTSLLSVFVVAVLIMAGATGLVIGGSTRCLRTESFESA